MVSEAEVGIAVLSQSFLWYESLEIYLGQDCSGSCQATVTDLPANQVISM